eukprot:g15863.t1
MVKIRQGWVLLYPLELLAAEAMGGAMSASVVGRVALAVGRVASAVMGGVVSVSAVGGVALALALGGVVLALVVGGVALASVVGGAVASAAVLMAFAVLEVVYPAAEDVTSSVGAPKVATWPQLQNLPSPYHIPKPAQLVPAS